MNKRLAEYQQTLIKKIFNYEVNTEGLIIEHNSLEKFEFSFRLQEKVINSKIEGEEGDELEKQIDIDLYNNDELILSAYLKAELNTITSYNTIQYLYQHIAVYLLRKDFYEEKLIFTKNSICDPVYFPASRTGFMHTYRAIIGNQRNNKEVINEVGIKTEEDFKQIAGTNLTLPTIVFLENLQKLNISPRSKEYYEEEIEFFEKSILKGKVSKNESDQYEFISQDNNQSVPLHVTSSLIAELSPMYLFLNSNIRSKLWIIEEIESHLNPKIQIEVIRLLVRLFNKGKSIWMTTHSDSLVQRINNIITLSSKKNSELVQQLGFENSDIFNDLDVIRAYEFYCVNDSTKVEELVKNEFGFEFIIFNDVIDTIIKETYFVQELDEAHD